MLETLVSLVNFGQNAVYYGFYYSYKTGHFLITTINYILYYFKEILSNILIVLSVISESLVIFMQDVLQYVQQFCHMVLNTCDGLFSTIIFVHLKTFSYLQTTIKLLIVLGTFVVQGVLNIYSFVLHVFVLTKKIIILFGSGVWFLITLVPILLYYGCVLFMSFLHNLFQEISDLCSNGLTNIKVMIQNSIVFVTDVPLESLAGLFIAISLAYIIAQFYVIIISYLKQQLRKVIVWIGRQALELKEGFWYVYSILQRRAQQEATERPVNRSNIQGRPSFKASVTIREERNGTSEEKYCVICQDRVKCVLLLPCKHLCLCIECTRDLRYYNDVCPICRTDIESTMKIFV